MVVVAVIHVAILALSFKLVPAPFDVFSVLSMAINFMLKVLLGLVDTLFAIAPCIGQRWQSTADKQGTAKDCCDDCAFPDHSRFLLVDTELSSPVPKCASG
jgi:hypothetical protein